MSRDYAMTNKCFKEFLSLRFQVALLLQLLGTRPDVVDIFPDGGKVSLQLMRETVKLGGITIQETSVGLAEAIPDSVACDGLVVRILLLVQKLLTQR